MGCQLEEFNNIFPDIFFDIYQYLIFGEDSGDGCDEKEYVEKAINDIPDWIKKVDECLDEKEQPDSIKIVLNELNKKE